MPVLVTTFYRNNIPFYKSSFLKFGSPKWNTLEMFINNKYYYHSIFYTCTCTSTLEKLLKKSENSTFV